MRWRDAPWTTRCASMALALAVTTTSAPASAAPGATPADAESGVGSGGAGAGSSAASSSASASSESTSAAAGSASAAAEGAAEAPPPAESEPPETTEADAATIEGQPPPSTVAGMGSSVISSNNPEARRARADLEGTALVTPQSGVPERMRPLQRAAWWTVFGTFALATTGGLFAGFAEVQEDRALRLASTLDPTTGGQYVYSDKQAEYEDILAKGERQAWIARGLLIGGGLTAIAAITIFAIDARRQQRVDRGTPSGARPRPTALRRGLRLGRTGLEVRF